MSALFKASVLLGLQVEDADRADGPHLDVSMSEGLTEVGLTLDRDEVAELHTVLGQWLEDAK